MLTWSYDAKCSTMNGPTGLIFAAKSRYTDQNWFRDLLRLTIVRTRTGTLLGLADVDAGIGTIQTGSNPAVLNPVGSLPLDVGGGMRTDDAKLWMSRHAFNQ